MPLEIEGHGWELHVKRIGLQSHSGSRVRTIGSYQVFIDGQPVLQLFGHICECTGPGDNTKNGKKHHLRIEEGRYPLSTQFGKLYRSVDFTNTTEHPLPGFLLRKTEVRRGILVHPAHPPNLYLSSIGCFNPTKPRTANQDMEFDDSRGRVIAVIESLKQHDPDAFADEENTRITKAFAVVSGEPMTPIHDAPV